MRTYAVYDRNKYILVGLGAIGLTCVIVDCVRNVSPNLIPSFKSDE